MRLQHEEGGQEVGPIEAVKVKILIKVCGAFAVTFHWGVRSPWLCPGAPILT